MIVTQSTQTVSVNANAQTVALDPSAPTIALNSAPVVSLSLVGTSTAVVTSETKTYFVSPVVQKTLVVSPAQPSVAVSNAGPQGPAGAGGNGGSTLEDSDIKVAEHNQTTPIHTNATSGRDFVALFQNGLI